MYISLLSAKPLGIGKELRLILRRIPLSNLPCKVEIVAIKVSKLTEWPLRTVEPILMLLRVILSMRLLGFKVLRV